MTQNASVARHVGRWAIAGLVALLVAAACSSSTRPKPAKGANAATGATPTTSAAAARPTTPSTVLVPTAGLPSFYAEPLPLPHAPAGTLLKDEPVQVPGLHGAMFRVMYLSTTARGGPVAVTGLVSVPSTPPPSGGYPVVSWAHGTNGMAPQCAPSLAPGPEDVALANALLDRGWVVTASDYQGEGTPGPLPYLVGTVAADNTIDIVRAARQLPAAHASATYAVWGHSEGGQTAMFALEAGRSYAPELHLVGVVAGAPPSDFGLIYPFLRNSPFRYYLLMVGGGFNAAYGSTAAPLDQLLTPLGASLLPDLTKGCDAYLMKTLDPYPLEQVVKTDPFSVPAWKALLSQNDPATFTTAVPVPLLIPQGGNDEQIPPVTTQLLTQHLCGIGQDVARWLYPGFSHAGVVPAYLGDMERWLADRFNGMPAPDPMTPSGAAGVALTTCP
jgi:alpha-beta hydrolase superfamily lysophospholipase